LIWFHLKTSILSHLVYIIYVF